MSIYWTYLPKRKIILSAWQKEIRLADWLAHAERLTRHHHYQQAESVLMDIQSARIGFDIPELSHTLENFADVAHPAKIAVVSSMPIQQARQIEQACQSINLNVVVFGTLHQACLWHKLDAVEIDYAIRRLLKKA